MSTWYEVVLYSLAIRPLEVEKVTSTRLYLKSEGRRFQDIRSSFSFSFPSRAEAVSYVKGELEKRLQQAERDVREYRSRLETLR